MCDKLPFWYSAVSNPSGEKIVDLFDVNLFEISGSRCPTHYSPAGNGDLLSIVVRQNIRMSGGMFSDIQDPDDPLIVFHIMIHVKTKNLSKSVHNFHRLRRVSKLCLLFNIT
jgi:hypothetical protein